MERTITQEKNKKVNKTVLAAMTGMLAVSIAACGGGEKADVSANNYDSSEDTSEDTSSFFGQEAPTEEPTYVTQPGDIVFGDKCAYNARHLEDGVPDINRGAHTGYFGLAHELGEDEKASIEEDVEYVAPSVPDELGYQDMIDLALTDLNFISINNFSYTVNEEGKELFREEYRELIEEYDTEHPKNAGYRPELIIHPYSYTDEPTNDYLAGPRDEKDILVCPAFSLVKDDPRNPELYVDNY